jgi:Spy/CpxP family protein refolding chaperone
MPIDTPADRTVAPRLIAAALLATAGFAFAPALAQPADEPDSPEAVLGGPEVEDRDAPGAATFGEPEMASREAREQRVPHRVFMGAIRGLASPEAPVGLELSDDQKSQIRAIEREHRDARRAFMRDHADELRALRGDRPPRGERGQRGERRGRDAGDGDPLSDPRRRPRGERGEAGGEDAQALRDLMGRGPDPTDAHTRIYALLTEEQRAFVDDEIERHRSEIDERIGRRKAEGLAERGLGRGGLADVDPETIRRRLEQLPPEVRQRVLQRLERVIDRELESAAPPPPPPSIDEVDVPPPLD